MIGHFLQVLIFQKMLVIFFPIFPLFHCQAETVCGVVVIVIAYSYVAFVCVCVGVCGCVCDGVCVMVCVCV